MMSSRRVESFLVRLVVDAGDAPDQAWRGRVRHVSSGCERQFDRLPDLLAFISAQLIDECTNVLRMDAPSSTD